MHSRSPAFSVLRAAVSGLLVAQLLWVLALAASPSWHERVHPEAAHDGHGDGEDHQHHEHECAVTLFLAGGCDCAPAPLLAVAPALVVCPEAIGCDLPLVVFSFRSRGIFEHAPPRSA